MQVYFVNTGCLIWNNNRNTHLRFISLFTILHFKTYHRLFSYLYKILFYCFWTSFKSNRSILQIYTIFSKRFFIANTYIRSFTYSSICLLVCNALVKSFDADITSTYHYENKDVHGKGYAKYYPAKKKTKKYIRHYPFPVLNKKNLTLQFEIYSNTPPPSHFKKIFQITFMSS